jgi:hypothetical protein
MQVGHKFIASAALSPEEHLPVCFRQKVDRSPIMGLAVLSL